MSDNLKRYCAIQLALKQLYPTETSGHFARHLNTLAALVSGIIASKKTNLPAIANKLPGASSPKGGKRESRIKRLSRFLQNPQVTPRAFFAPYAQALLQSLPPDPLVLVMDGSAVGRDCMALMVSVVYQKRALPLCWQVVKAKKGHLSQEHHQELLKQAQALIGSNLGCGRSVLFLGDGEFDGTGLLATITQAGWQYVCRTAKNVRLCESDWPEEDFALCDLPVQRGDTIELADVLFTAQGFGPVLVGAVWESGYKEPLYLVTNLDFLAQACFWYKKRFTIETFFSDQKSRGFYLCHSHLSDPARLSRLLMATCLAYYWMVCLGAEVVGQGWQAAIHRTERRDLSLFQLGLVWLDHCLNEGWHVPVRLQTQTRK